MCVKRDTSIQFGYNKVQLDKCKNWCHHMNHLARGLVLTALIEGHPQSLARPVSRVQYQLGE